MKEPKNSRMGRPRLIEGDETGRLTALVPLTARKRFIELAQARGATASTLLRRLILDFLSAASGVGAVEQPHAEATAVVILPPPVRRPRKSKKKSKKAPRGGSPRNSRAAR